MMITKGGEMKISEDILPSNSKFGYLFSLVFLLISTYFYYRGSLILSYALGFATLTFIGITILLPNKLTPLNLLWMKFGALIGMVVNPIIMGVIFFGLFTPVGLVMALFGRDELRLRLKARKSYWKYRPSTNLDFDSFKQQF